MELKPLSEGYTPAVSRKRRILLWCIPAVIACLIFCFSQQDGDESSALSNGVIVKFFMLLHDLVPAWRSMSRDAFMEMLSLPVRKAAHVTEYLILCLSLLPALKASSCKLPYRYPAAFLITALYACTDEFHQRFIPGRCGCLTDVLIDSSGAFVLMLILMLLYVHSGRKQRPATS